VPHVEGRWSADAGSIPAASTIYPGPTALRWPFFCGKAQACGGSWGFLRTTPIALRRGSGRVSLSPGGSSLLVGGGLRAKSASSQICVLTSHVVTRGPIERLDGIIAYQEEITNRGESLDRAAEITENRVRRHQSPAQRPPKQGDIEAESLLLELPSRGV